MVWEIDISWVPKAQMHSMGRLRAPISHPVGRIVDLVQAQQKPTEVATRWIGENLEEHFTCVPVVRMSCGGIT